MSWLEKIQTEFIIQTGDGKQFKPTWVRSTFKSEYNVASFNFPDVEGTLVKRGTVMGREFNLIIIFQGEDNIEQGLDFWESTKNRKPWVIQHPYYGQIIVQPSTLQFDNSQLNVTQITGNVLETIPEENPRSSIAPTETIKRTVEEMEDTLAESLDETPSAADVDLADINNQKFYKTGFPIIEIPEEFENYYNVFNAASAAITTAISTPITFMRTIVALINYPANFTLGVQIRLNQLLEQWEALTSTVENLFDTSSKKIFQAQGAANIAAMCYTAATPLSGNYSNNSQVISVITQLIETYDSYLENLDALQSENAGNPENWVPDAAILFELSNLVTLTVSNLFDIALSAKQQRSIILEKDDNIITLTHRLYGLDPDDKNMEELIINNGWGLNNILQIKKGTIVYYYI